jgi:hypothetical protein
LAVPIAHSLPVVGIVSPSGHPAADSAAAEAAAISAAEPAAIPVTVVIEEAAVNE